MMYISVTVYMHTLPITKLALLQVGISPPNRACSHAIGLGNEGTGNYFI